MSVRVNHANWDQSKNSSVRKSTIIYRLSERVAIPWLWVPDKVFKGALLSLNQNVGVLRTWEEILDSSAVRKKRRGMGEIKANIRSVFRRTNNNFSLFFSPKVLDVEGVSEKLQDTPKSERKKLQKQKTGDSSRTTVRKTYEPRMNSLQNARCKFR